MFRSLGRNGSRRRLTLHATSLRWRQMAGFIVDKEAGAGDIDCAARCKALPPVDAG